MMIFPHTLLHIDVTIHHSSAENGSVAFDMLKVRSEEFIAVVTDLRMPVMDGLVSTIKSREFGVKTPIILLTVERGALLEAATEAGVNLVLEKPPSAMDMQKAFESIGISIRL